jgi:lipoate-protein ligase B
MKHSNNDRNTFQALHRNKININTEVRQFLQDNPLGLTSSMRIDHAKQKEEVSSTTAEIRRIKDLTKLLKLPTTADISSVYFKI